MSYQAIRFMVLIVDNFFCAGAEKDVILHSNMLTCNSRQKLMHQTLKTDN